jgi:hypothetical protein
MQYGMSQLEGKQRYDRRHARAAIRCLFKTVAIR